MSTSSGGRIGLGRLAAICGKRIANPKLLAELGECGGQLPTGEDLGGLHWLVDLMDEGAAPTELTTSQVVDLMTALDFYMAWPLVDRLPKYLDISEAEVSFRDIVREGVGILEHACRLATTSTVHWSLLVDAWLERVLRVAWSDRSRETASSLASLLALPCLRGRMKREIHNMFKPFCEPHTALVMLARCALCDGACELNATFGHAHRAWDGSPSRQLAAAAAAVFPDHLKSCDCQKHMQLLAAGGSKAETEAAMRLRCGHPPQFRSFDIEEAGKYTGRAYTASMRVTEDGADSDSDLDEGVTSLTIGCAGFLRDRWSVEASIVEPLHVRQSPKLRIKWGRGYRNKPTTFVLHARPMRESGGNFDAAWMKQKFRDSCAPFGSPPDTERPLEKFVRIPALKSKDRNKAPFPWDDVARRGDLLVPPTVPSDTLTTRQVMKSVDFEMPGLRDGDYVQLFLYAWCPGWFGDGYRNDINDGYVDGFDMNE